MKEFEPPTYEQYVKATSFARFKYKYGLIVVVIAYITLIALFVYVFNYVQELSTHPMLFAIKRMNLDFCTCQQGSLTYLINETTIAWQQNPYSYNPL